MNHNLIKIQSYFRGFVIRKKNRELNDSMTLDIINGLLNNHINTINYNDKMNQKLSKKKIRNPNFPSEISENIVKYVLVHCKNYKIFPNWDTECGDLDWVYKKLEIKCFSSQGPSSFGPTEKWDILYFLDATDFINKNFKLYEIRLSNKNDIWGNIKMNKKDTYKQQCENGKRPHISFEKIKEQLYNINENYCKLIWSGNISELNNTF